MLKFYILIVVVLQQSKVNCQEKSLSIQTCCKLQSSLGPSGFCEQPTSEFDVQLFPSRWEVPGIFLNALASQVVFELKTQGKRVWCECGKSIKHSITLGRGSSNSRDAWIPKSSESMDSYITPEGQLLTNGKEYGNEQYCLNKLSEIEFYGQQPDELDIEIVMCSKVCTSASKTRTDWIAETEECKDEFPDSNNIDRNSSEIPGCNWASFTLIEKDDLLLFNYNENATPIHDQTYPWESLPKETYCKSERDQSDTTDLQFCLQEIKKLFYGYQKLYAILAGVSAIFLLFNLTIYFALRESLSISGWTEFLYSFALYIYCVLSIPAVLIVPDSTDIRPICYALGVLTQFFELANGATLVALSFDIWWTFCKFDKGSYTDDPKVSKLRMSMYFIFSLSFPIAIVCYGVSKNHRPWDFKFDDKSGVPQYGLLHCTAPDWPMTSYTQFTMQGINLLLALISAYTILNKNRRYLDDEGSLLDPDRMDIFAKLFVFVFVFWIINFMQFFLRLELFTTKWYLIAFQVINYSQGIFAFFILVCNRRTMSGIRQKDWSLMNLFKHACCTCTSNRGGDDNAEAELPLSPLMKSTKFQRSTIRGNAFY